MRNIAACGSLIAALLSAPSVARAVPIVGPLGSGEEGIGSFTGTFDYVPIDAFSGTLTIQLTNTSPPANGGYITAVVFNLADGVSLTGSTSLVAPNASWALLNSPDNVPASPFGDFDIGAALGGSFNGGGSPNAGIFAGTSGTFIFNLVGSGLGAPLGPGDFLSETSTDPQGGGAQALVVRFRGFEDGGSDKVPVDTGAPIPEPGTLALLGLGLASLSARRLASRKH